MSFSAELKAGQYWIGDPCYVFPNDGPMKDKWDEILAASDFFEKEMPAEIDNGKIQVWASFTAYGDGCYLSNMGDEFPVDAGLIGIVPLETIEYLGRADNNLNKLGLFVTFHEDFTIHAEAGRFRFCDIIIDTNDDDFEDEYCNDNDEV